VLGAWWARPQAKFRIDGHGAHRRSFEQALRAFDESFPGYVSVCLQVLLCGPLCAPTNWGDVIPPVIGFARAILILASTFEDLSRARARPVSLHLTRNLPRYQACAIICAN
jgi:hypothetical protein